jgi:hypothetical protein
MCATGAGASSYSGLRRRIQAHSTGEFHVNSEQAVNRALYLDIHMLSTCKHAATGAGYRNRRFLKGAIG